MTRVTSTEGPPPPPPPPQGLLAYAIPGHDDGGRLFYYGNTNAKKIVFFCGGWPDDCSVFVPLAQRLAAATTDVLCGVTCLPGYDNSTPINTNHPSRQYNYRWNAFTSTEIVASLQEACKLLRATVSTNSDATLTGVFHDWGCVFGAMLVAHVRKEEALSSYFTSLVYLDILPPVHPNQRVSRSVNLHQAVVVSLYTCLFAVAHALYRYVSYYVALPVLGVGFGILTTLGLLPTRTIDAKTFRITQQPRLSYRKILYMQYPYFNLYKGLLTGDKQTTAGFHLPVSIQDTPVLYMYGLEKNIMFHNGNMLAWLMQQAAKDGSKTKVIPVPHAGHWLFLQQPDVCFEAIRSFLNDV